MARDVAQCDFLADETYFHLLLLACNSVNWFKRPCLPPEFHNATLQTLHQRVLLLPAHLVRAGSRPRLDLPANSPREAAWQHDLRAVHQLGLQSMRFHAAFRFQ